MIFTSLILFLYPSRTTKKCKKTKIHKVVKLTAGPIDEHPFWGKQPNFQELFAVSFPPIWRERKDPRRRPHQPAPIFAKPSKFRGPEKKLWSHFKAVATRAKNQQKTSELVLILSPVFRVKKTPLIGAPYSPQQITCKIPKKNGNKRDITVLGSPGTLNYRKFRPFFTQLIYRKSKSSFSPKKAGKKNYRIQWLSCKLHGRGFSNLTGIANSRKASCSWQPGIPQW